MASPGDDAQYSPLYPKGDGSFCGTWEYAPNAFYRIERAAGSRGSYRFLETRADGERVAGSLAAKDGWLTGRLFQRSKNWGAIRIRHDGPERIVANIRHENSPRWGRDVVANRTEERDRFCQYRIEECETDADVSEESLEAQAHVLIIGAGFAGMKAARELRKNFRVTICDCKDYFQFSPGVLRAFVDPGHFDKVIMPLQPVIEGEMGCAFLWAEVERVDPASRQAHVQILEGQPGVGCHGSPRNTGTRSRPRTPRTPRSATPRSARSAPESCSAARRAGPEVVDFDYCVIAAGCAYNKLASTEGSSLWFPTILDQRRSASEWAHLDERTMSGRRQHCQEEHKKLQDLDERGGHVLVVGGGFIGVEWAMEMHSFFPGLRFTLVTRPNQLLARWPQHAIAYSMARLEETGCIRIILGKHVNPDDPQSLRDLDIEGVDVSYSCTGAMASVGFLPPEVLTASPATERNGWVRTNRQLMVMAERDGELSVWSPDSHGYGRVFAIGDCATIEGLPPLPKACYPAEEYGFVVSRIISMIQGYSIGSPERSLGCGSILPLPEAHWPWGAGMVILSLGPSDAVFLLAATHEAGSGVVALKGCLAALQKDFIEYSKVSETRMGMLGTMVWHYVHNTPVHLWGGGPLCGY